MSDLVVVLTAMNLEYVAVRDRLVSPRAHRHSKGTLFDVGRLATGRSRIALGLVGKGNISAAALAERAVEEFAPAAVMFVGVAGALWPNVRLGDVVVASQVYAYHGATSVDTGLQARPRAWEIRHAAAQLAQRVDRDGTWADDLHTDPRPKVHFGPIAAGEIVQDSAVSAQATWIRQHYNDALAIEMEAAGAAQAAHLNDVTVVVVRGISDRADGTKTETDGENWQPRAAAHAAAFAVALADQLADSTPAAAPTSHLKGGPAPMATTNTFINKGNARIGNQIGTNNGAVYLDSAGLTTSPQFADLHAAINDLRIQLEQAHQTGRLDQETYTAATTELDTASTNLTQQHPQSATRIMLAFKRLRGLVSDLADIATRVAGIITVAKEL